MKALEKIDKAITESVETLYTQIEKLSFKEICEFKLNKKHIAEIPWGTLNYPGVYLIEIKNNQKYNTIQPWIANFKREWEDKKYLKCFTPNLKKKRIEKHSTLKEWMPLYIGKSKKIEGRIHEHIFKELHKTTYALKLNARKNLQQETFRLKTIKCPVENYNIIIPIIESTLRNRINPLIGRQ